METSAQVPTISSRQFNQDASGAKRAAAEGPVVITDRGHPAHVLMTIDEYRRLTGQCGSIVDLLAMVPTGTNTDDMEFEPCRAQFGFRAADLG